MTSLTDSLQFLKGIGPARATSLAAAGFRTAWDVLHTFPRLLGPPPPLAETGTLPAGETVRLRAQLIVARPRFAGGRGMALEASLRRADGLPLTARFFNAGFLRRLLVPGEWFLWEGRLDDKKPGLLLHPAFRHVPGGLVAAIPEEAACRVAYRLPEGVGERAFAGLVDQLLEQVLPQCADPAGLLDAVTWQASLRQVHHPDDAAEHETARRTLAQRELLALAWTLRGRRVAFTGVPGQALRWNDETHVRALARLPFTLTPGQGAALADIRHDAMQATPMYRLLQGDVGSGKTALALVTVLAAIAEQRQAALLAPTSVLAQQHADFIASCLVGSRVHVGLLTGGTSAREREQLLAATANGSCHLLVGTHALLTDEVHFHDLAVVVIDEQHKFGVQQRAALVNKATIRPHLLLMTATPIPRTLALTAFGDLAVSRIVGKPPGRAAVSTEVRVGGLAQALPLLGTLESGDQAIVICALREAGEKSTAHDVAQVFAAVQATHGSAVEIVHGNLSDERKLAVMARFRTGAIRILVATTVIEVGIDVPTLALALVLDADRFGLAQLHQLRGRLGRGSRPGRCVLLHGPKAEGQRLAVLAASDDGLAIAEADLMARGPGELLGSQQHGVLRLRVADLGRDLDLLQEAHQQVSIAETSASMPVALAPWVPGSDHVLAGAG